MHKYAITGDVVKMFRQIKVNPKYWNYQRILWRPNKNEPIKEYLITVVVWGMKSATYNSVRSLRQCAIDEAEKYPNAARVALNDFYVDDLLSGENDTESLSKLHDELSEMLSSGGFELSKWCTNNPILAKKFKQNSDVEVDIHQESGVLGMTWVPNIDECYLKCNYIDTDFKNNPTKSEVVSSISKVYDPSGLFGPTILIGKLIMQDFWRVPDIGWKDPAPKELVKRWQEYMLEVKILTSISVPRWVGYTSVDEIEFHIFTDACEKAYCAVAYLRVIRSDNSITVTVLTSKSRVAPIKTQCLPRLELFGAVLGSALSKYVKSACKKEEVNTYFWTDSSIVLRWINKEPALLLPRILQFHLGIMLNQKKILPMLFREAFLQIV